MRTVSIRELKSHLSEYLRRVQGGESFLVTDRGRVVAEIREPGTSYEVKGIPSGLLDLAAEGDVRLGRPIDPSEYPILPRLAPDGTAAALLAQDRAV
jgi:hypothetical protein